MDKASRLLPALAELAAAGREPGQPDALFRAADRIMQPIFGHILFTVLEIHFEDAYLGRLYTNRPDVYPVGGRKPIPVGTERAQMMADGVSFLGRTPDDIRREFPDHETIIGLGCGSLMNLRIRYNGETLGGLNVLAAEGRLTEQSVEDALPFAALLTPALVARRGGGG